MLRFSDQRELSYPKAAYEKRASKITGFLDSLSMPGLHRVYPEKVFCDSFREGACVQAIDGDIFYYDDDHLSVTGANQIAPYVSQTVLAALD